MKDYSYHKKVIDDVITKLKGITCESNPTSCTDQLARALEKEL